MKIKTSLFVLGAALLAGGAATLFCFVLEKSNTQYRETNATWKIQGLCTNVQNGNPIKDVQVTASFREPIRFKHLWRNPPPLATTNIVAKTDEQGLFEINGEGASVYITLQAEGYREPEPWENWSYTTRNEIFYVGTNIALGLKPRTVGNQ